LFLHISLQNFLSARPLSRLPHSRQVLVSFIVFQKFVEEPGLSQAVIKFLYGGPVVFFHLPDQVTYGQHVFKGTHALAG